MPKNNNRMRGISSISIKNFKGFGQEREIPILPITVFSGLNNSGKSTIYQAVLLIKQTIEKQHDRNYNKNKLDILPELAINGEILQLGLIEDILFDKKQPTIKLGIGFEQGGKLEFSFTKQLQNEEVSKYVSSTESMILSECNMEGGRRGKKFKSYFKIQDNSKIIIANNFFSFLDSNVQSRLDELLKIVAEKCNISSKGHYYATDVFLSNFDWMRFQMNGLFLISLKPEHVIQIIDKKIVNIIGESALQELIISTLEQAQQKSVELISHALKLYTFDIGISDIEYIKPFRGIPYRFYDSTREISFAQQFNYNRNFRVAYKINLNGRFMQASLESALAYWVSFFFGEEKKISVTSAMDGLVQAVYLNIDSETSVPLNNLGFGVSQILPILLKCLLSARHSLIILDEPEAHLHPSMQSKLADFLLVMSKLGKRFIVETHSEYILDRLIYHGIKDKEVANIVKMYWVSNDTNKGANVEAIIYDELGYLINTPEGFLTEKQRMVEELTELRFSKMQENR